jgi:hypothetical protein
MFTKEDLKARISLLERLHYEAVIAFQEYDSHIFCWPSKLKELDENITNYYARKCELLRLVEKM